MPLHQIGQRGRRMIRKHGPKRGKAYRLKLVSKFSKPRGFRLAKNPRQPLSIPMKIGYTYDVIGAGTSSVNFDADIGMQFAPAAWFARYEPIFDYIRINKVRIEILAPYNIGQHGIGTQSLYQMWSKKALSTAEVPPGSTAEWLNMQSATRKTFSGTNNSVVFYFTPAYETTVQPLNVAVTQLRLIYKQWQSIKTAAANMTPHIGILGTISRLDGSIIGNTNVFKVNVTMYTELKGIKQL